MNPADLAAIGLVPDEERTQRFYESMEKSKKEIEEFNQRLLERKRSFNDIFMEKSFLVEHVYRSNEGDLKGFGSVLNLGVVPYEDSGSNPVRRILFPRDYSIRGGDVVEAKLFMGQMEYEKSFEFFPIETLHRAWWVERGLQEDNWASGLRIEGREDWDYCPEDEFQLLIFDNSTRDAVYRALNL